MTQRFPAEHKRSNAVPEEHTTEKMVTVNSTVDLTLKQARAKYN